MPLAGRRNSRIDGETSATQVCQESVERHPQMSAKLKRSMACR